VKYKLIETSTCRTCGQEILWLGAFWVHTDGHPKDKHRAEPSGHRQGKAVPVVKKKRG
jgi:hypothetical protein